MHTDKFSGIDINPALYYTGGKSKGYLNLPLIISNAYKNGCYIIIGVGGRGTGKTYGMLKMTLDHDWTEIIPGSQKKFIYLRRKQKHVAMANRSMLCPYKKVNSDTNSSVYCFKIPETDLAAIYHCEHDDERPDKIYPVGDNIGIMAALSTFYDTRSIDFSDVGIIFYDEFIPEKREQRMANEGYTFNNVLETVNRNREIEGAPPIMAVCLANSEKLENALFMFYGLVKIAMKMREKGEEILYLKDKGICLIDMVNSPISQVKSEGFLYNKVNKGNRFAEMSISNKYDIDTAVKTQEKINYKSYRPVVSIGELCIYEQKSGDKKYYVSYHKSGNPDHFEITFLDCERFRKYYRWLYFLTVAGEVVFEDYSAYVLFNEYINYK